MVVAIANAENRGGWSSKTLPCLILAAPAHSLWAIHVPFYRDRIYPHLIRMLGDPSPIRNIRQRILPRAQGKVLEIGVGAGANLLHYDPAKVSKLFALEPNPGMLRLAERQRRQTPVDVEFL